MQMHNKTTSYVDSVYDDRADFTLQYFELNEFCDVAFTDFEASEKLKQIYNFWG